MSERGRRRTNSGAEGASGCFFFFFSFSWSWGAEFVGRWRRVVPLWEAEKKYRDKYGRGKRRMRKRERKRRVRCVRGSKNHLPAYVIPHTGSAAACAWLANENRVCCALDLAVVDQGSRKWVPMGGTRPRSPPPSGTTATSTRRVHHNGIRSWENERFP